MLFYRYRKCLPKVEFQLVRVKHVRGNPFNLKGGGDSMGLLEKQISVGKFDGENISVSDMGRK